MAPANGPGTTSTRTPASSSRCHQPDRRGPTAPASRHRRPPPRAHRVKRRRPVRRLTATSVCSSIRTSRGPDTPDAGASGRYDGCPRTRCGPPRPGPAAHGETCRRGCRPGCRPGRSDPAQLRASSLISAAPRVGHRRAGSTPGTCRRGPRTRSSAVGRDAETRQRRMVSTRRTVPVGVTDRRRRWQPHPDGVHRARLQAQHPVEVVPAEQAPSSRRAPVGQLHARQHLAVAHQPSHALDATCPLSADRA